MRLPAPPRSEEINPALLVADAGVVTVKKDFESQNYRLMSGQMTKNRLLEKKSLNIYVG